MGNGVKDQIEQFNWQRDEAEHKFPSTMRRFLPDVRDFCQKCHRDVLFKVFQCEYRMSHTAECFKCSRWLLRSL